MSRLRWNVTDENEEYEAPAPMSGLGFSSMTSEAFYGCTLLLLVMFSPRRDFYNLIYETQAEVERFAVACRTEEPRRDGTRSELCDREG